MDMMLKDKVDALEVLLGNLGKGDKVFAASLIAGFNKYGKLSDKQVPWVDKLLERAMSEKKEPVKVELGSFDPVYVLFEKAKEHLKYPKINLAVGGMPLVMYLSGGHSKVPNVVNVTDGKPFGENKWYGRVMPDGTWVKGFKEFPELPDVEKLLRRFGADPAGVAKQYGNLSGKCCFCNLPLSDPKSTAAGFGPTCADHYGLKDEWKKAVSFLEKEAA